MFTIKPLTQIQMQPQVTSLKFQGKVVTLVAISIEEDAVWFVRTKA